MYTISYTISHSYWHGGEFKATGQLYKDGVFVDTNDELAYDATETGSSECFDDSGIITLYGEPTRERIKELFAQEMRRLVAFYH